MSISHGSNHSQNRTNAVRRAADLRYHLRAVGLQGVAFVSVAVLSACVTPPTGYVEAESPSIVLPRKGNPVPATTAYGYSTTAVAPGIHTIEYRGNAQTGGSDAEDFVLLRAAELALEHRCPYFVVNDRGDATRSHSSTSTTPGTYVCDKRGRCSFQQGHSVTTTWAYPSRSLTIALLFERPTELDRFALNAAFLRDHLRARQELPGIADSAPPAAPYCQAAQEAP